MQVLNKLKMKTIFHTSENFTGFVFYVMFEVEERGHIASGYCELLNFFSGDHTNKFVRKYPSPHHNLHGDNLVLSNTHLLRQLRIALRYGLPSREGYCSLLSKVNPDIIIGILIMIGNKKIVRIATVVKYFSPIKS